MANSAEIAIVGRDDLVGISLFMGGESTTNRAELQSVGEGFRLKASLLMLEFNCAGPAGNLDKAGMIPYGRGHITVLDCSGLEKRTCWCYATVKHEYDRLLLTIIAEELSPAKSMFTSAADLSAEGDLQS